MSYTWPSLLSDLPVFYSSLVAIDNLISRACLLSNMADNVKSKVYLFSVWEDLHDKPKKPHTLDHYTNIIDEEKLWFLMPIIILAMFFWPWLVYRELVTSI